MHLHLHLHTPLLLPSPCPHTPTTHPTRDALRIIALREDYKTARVGGKTLGQLFSGAVEGVMSIRVPV